LYSAGVRPAEGVYAIKCAMHYHVHRLIDALQRHTTSVLNTFWSVRQPPARGSRLHGSNRAP